MIGTSPNQYLDNYWYPETYNQCLSDEVGRCGVFGSNGWNMHVTDDASNEGVPACCECVLEELYDTGNTSKMLCRAIRHYNNLLL